MKFRVIFSPEAEEDLERIFDHAFQRTLKSPTGDLEIADGALETTRQSCAMLAINPFCYRKVGEGVFVRELVVPLDATGFVAMFEIQNAETVRIGSIRHQRESDYH
jgi:plasmid stabilization system protein ParE